MIPRRIAYRIWCAVAADHARHLRSLAEGRHADPGRGRPVGGPSKAAGRLAMAAVAERTAATLSRWIAGAGPPGGDLEPAIVAHVAAWLLGRSESWPEIRRALRRPGPAPDPEEPIDLIRRVLE